MIITEKDKALAAGIAEAPPLESAGRVYIIKIAPLNGPVREIQGRFPSAVDAVIENMDDLDPMTSVSARPAVEVTYAEGAARYPEQLHSKAFCEAWRGWHEMAAKQFPVSDAALIRADERRALDDQMHRAAYMNHFSGRSV